MAGFTPSKTVTEFAAAGASPAATTTTTTLGPRKRAKKQVGYGLIYSDDEIEPIAPKPLPSQLAAMKAAAAANGSTTSTNTTTTTPTSTRTTTTGRNTPRYEEAPVGHVHGSGIKKLVFEKKKKYTEGKSNEELYGRQEAISTKRTTSSATVDNKKARSSRMSPYGTHTPVEKKINNYSSDEEVTPVAAKKGKTTMRGALETPKQARQRRASPDAPPRTPQQRQQQPAPAPTTPAATPAPAARLRNLWKAATSFLASPVSKAAGLVRDMDVEINPATPSEDDESPAAPEREEQEHRWPGSFRKTPEPETPPAPEYINPDMAKDPYAYAAFSPRPASFGALYKKAQEKAARRYTVSFDGKHRYWGTAPRHLIRNQEQSEVITVPDGSKRARSSYKLTGKTPEQQKAILEEIEREIEHNRRERRVLERLDLEKRRVALAQMGVDWAEVEEKEREEREERGESTEDDTDTESRRLKKANKGKEKEGAKVPEPSPESTEATPTEPTPPPSQPTSFLFGGGSYKAPEVPVAPVSAPAAPVSTPAAPAAAPAAPASPTRARSPPRAPSPTKVTKKKTPPKRSPPPSARSPAPPATPTLSHATLPNPVAPSGSALLPPPPPPPPTAAAQQKAVSGLGFADPAHKARSQAEKFKPHVSSGLRASTTIQADSPPRAAPGLNFKPFFQPPQPPSAPVPPPTKKLAPAFPLKTKKLGANGRPIVEVNQVYLDKFLEAIVRGKSGDEKILSAVKGVWREPPVEETGPVYQLFVSVLGNTCPPV